MHVSYTVLRADGSEYDGGVMFPDEEDDPARKKRWSAVRAAVVNVIGEDADPEHVRVWHAGRYLDMFVDETGALEGLPVNAKATAIYHANVLEHDPDGPDGQEIKAGLAPEIHGDAVLFHEPVWD